MNICVYLWSVVRFVEVAWLPRPLLYAVIFTGVPLDKRRVLGRLRSIRDTELHDHYPRARRWNSCINSHSCQHSMWYWISWFKVHNNKSNLNIAAATVEGCMGTATVWSDTAQSWGAASSLLMGCRTSKNRTETLMLFGYNNIAKEVFWSCICQLLNMYFCDAWHTEKDLHLRMFTLCYSVVSVWSRCSRQASVPGQTGWPAPSPAAGTAAAPLADFHFPLEPVTGRHHNTINIFRIDLASIHSQFC